MAQFDSSCCCEPADRQLWCGGTGPESMLLAKEYNLGVYFREQHTHIHSVDGE